MLTGCPHVPPQIITGSGPNGPALEPATHTLYVPNFYDGTTSIVATHDPTITSREDALATSPYPLPHAESIGDVPIWPGLNKTQERRCEPSDRRSHERSNNDMLNSISQHPSGRCAVRAAPPQRGRTRLSGGDRRGAER
jgi:hypothetical protein